MNWDRKENVKQRLMNSGRCVGDFKKIKIESLQVIFA